MKNNCRLLLLLTLISGHCIADQYAIQLEASKAPRLERFESLSKLGTLYTEAAGNGYIRTRIGPYESKKLALDVLNEVHAAGYTAAIITQQKNSYEILPSVSSQQFDIQSFDVKTLKEWSMLTQEQQSNLVYLDGVLHVKNGNRFIPLSDIISQE